MIGIAIALLALSVGDLAAGGITGEPRRFGPLLWGAGAAGASCWIVISASNLPTTTSVVLWIGTLFGTSSWLSCKLMLGRAEQRPNGRDASPARRWANAALLASGLTLAVPLVFAPVLQSDLPQLTSWAQALPFERAHGLTGAELLLLLGILLFLTASANSIVRTLLTSARTDWKASEQRVRGGRYIGIIERWMIFALALAGEPTAAALIVSAKSLLRFPELSRTGTDNDVDIDAVTEYFLLGSLTSWALALAFVVLLI